MNKFNIINRVKIFFSVSYFCFLIYAVFFAAQWRHFHLRHINIVPIKNSLKDYCEKAIIGPFNYYSNLLGNILLFIPLPFIIIPWFKIARFYSVIFIGLLLSLSIETLQYFFAVGLSDIDDIILNTLGTALGLFAYKLYRNISNNYNFSY